MLELPARRCTPLEPALPLALAPSTHRPPAPPRLTLQGKALSRVAAADLLRRYVGDAAPARTSEDGGSCCSLASLRLPSPAPAAPGACAMGSPRSSMDSDSGCLSTHVAAALALISSLYR